MKLESLGVPRDLAINGGKKFRDGLVGKQADAYKEYQYYAAFKAFVMKYRHIRNMTNALNAAKPLVLHTPEALDSDPMLLNTPGGTYYLPEGLRDVALTRLENPDATLKELGSLMADPVGKSGVNHRLRKISEIADKLRG